MGRDLSDFPIQYIKGVGPKRAKLLNRLGIKSVKDALYYFPYRYEDRTNIKKISDLKYGYIETVYGRIVSAEIIKLRGRNLRIFEISITDGSGILKGKWFNQPYMKKNLKIGSDVILYGLVKRNPYWGIGFEMDNPEYEVINDLQTLKEVNPNIDQRDDALIHMNRITPIYRVTSGLSVRQMRSIMFNIISRYVKEVSEVMPIEILNNNALPGISESLMQIHFPDSNVDIDLFNNKISDFHRRLSFEELFMLELGLAVMKKNNIVKKGIKFSPKGDLLKRFFENLPFRLTNAQERVFNDIKEDMERPYPMNRLIQGDVGCGKTVVALMAILISAECGYQSALMAPTEVLAEQHYITLHSILEEIGLKAGLLTGSKRDKPLKLIASGEIDIIIGTHALIQEKVEFKKLGLIVIDEQHRFGVMQRAMLRRKADNPDVLVMTATPIPRTLALTLYSDLDYSVIDELPPGRRPIKTLLIHSEQKEYVYRLIEQEVRKGRQVYVVYPIIEESEKTDLKSAILGKKAFEKIFPEFKIMLLHGRMKPNEREKIMSLFKHGEIDILVSTTVIEVGVDVPNATIMVIIHAERFGLSQLHQLRGRIGRGLHQSYCILIAYRPYGEDARRRLDVMIRTNDGFKIAEEDLNIRGPGEFFGTRQSGMPDLRIANIVRDSKILNQAKREAFDLIEKDQDLKAYPYLKKTLEKFWEGRIELFKTG